MYILAVIILSLAFPLGAWLKKMTGEESKQGRKYIIALFYLSVLLSVVSLFLRQDHMVFSFLFILIISYQSLKN